MFMGLVCETPDNEPLYFGVIEGKGGVHPKSVGTVAVPDGRPKVEIVTEEQRRRALRWRRPPSASCALRWERRHK